MLDIDKVIPDLSHFTSASTFQDFDTIGRWEVGQQVVALSKENVPYVHSRTFSVPQPIEAPTYASKIELSYDLDGGRRFYRTEVAFTVVEYSSQVAASLTGYSSTPSEGDFMRWKRRELHYIHEEYRHDRESSRTVYERPLSDLDPIFREIPPPENLPHILAIPHPRKVLLFSTGKALAFSYEGYGTGECTATLSGEEIPPGEQTDLQGGEFPRFSFTTLGILIRLYGEEVAQSLSYPTALLSPEEVAIHAPGTSHERRVLPPGAGNSELPSLFWNDPAFPKVEVGAYTSRKSKGWYEEEEDDTNPPG